MRKIGTEDIGRREFLRGSLAAVAAGLTAASPLRDAGASTSSVTIDSPRHQGSEDPPPILGERRKFLTPYAVFRELQLGSVIPQGWLLEELTKQANRLSRPQSDFAFPFDRRYWASNERGQNEESRNGGIFWYPWEQMGYWADGSYRCAKLTNDGHLHKQAMESIRYTVDHPVDGWYLGPKLLHDLPASKDPGRWPQAVFFRALAGASEGENDPRIMTAMCTHYLRDTGSDYQHGPYGPRDRVNIESILWCYAHSGDERLLLKAKEIWSKVPPSDLEELTADRPSNMHGVTFAEVSKLAALLYMYTGNTQQLDVSVAAMHRIF